MSIMYLATPTKNTCLCRVRGYELNRPHLLYLVVVLGVDTRSCSCFNVTWSHQGFISKMGWNARQTARRKLSSWVSQLGKKVTLARSHKTWRSNLRLCNIAYISLIRSTKMATNKRRPIYYCKSFKISGTNKRRPIYYCKSFKISTLYEYYWLWLYL